MVQDSLGARRQLGCREDVMLGCRRLTTALLCALAAPAAAETIDVNDAHGGSVVQYNVRWAGLAARGVDVRIVGPCESACTILLGHIPRNKICVTPAARFGFHLAQREF